MPIKIPITRIREAAMAKQSPLYTWMVENHDRLLGELQKAVRPDWTALTQLFAEKGLTNADGKPLTETTARRSWRRALKAVAAQRAGAKTKSGRHAKKPAHGIVEETPSTAARSKTQSPIPATTDTQAPAPKPRYVFKLATLKKSLPANPKS
jgi:hypothetical protein